MPTPRPRPESFDPRLTEGRARIDRYRAARAEERGNELAGLSEDELIRFDGVEGQLIQAAVDAANNDAFVVSNTIQGRLPGSSSADAPSVVEYRSDRLRERGDRYPEGELSDRLVEHRRFVEVREAVILRLGSPRYGDSVGYARSVRDAEKALGSVDHDLMRTAIALEVGASELTARVHELERVMESAPNRAQRALTAALPGIAIATKDPVTGSVLATSEQEVSAAAVVALTAAADFRARLGRQGQADQTTGTRRTI